MEGWDQNRSLWKCVKKNWFTTSKQTGHLKASKSGRVSSNLHVGLRLKASFSLSPLWMEKSPQSEFCFQDLTLSEFGNHFPTKNDKVWIWCGVRGLSNSVSPYYEDLRLSYPFSELLKWLVIVVIVHQRSSNWNSPPTEKKKLKLF